jgi:hypothetical protein
MPKVSARRKRKPEAPRKSKASSKRTREARLDHKSRSRADKLDMALEMTFPASDPVAIGKPTSTEAMPNCTTSPRMTGTAQHWIEIWTWPWAMWTAWTMALSPFHRASMRRISNDNDPHLNS